MSDQKRVEDVIDKILRRSLAQLRTTLPGIITNYDATKCEAEVLQTVFDFDADGEQRYPQVITHVPVAFLGGGIGNRTTYPVVKGDRCLLIFAGSAIDSYIANGTQGWPKSKRHHHITDCIALVFGIANADRPPANKTAVVMEGDDLRIGGDDALGVPTKASVDALKDTLNTLISAFKVHTHLAAGNATGVPNNAGSVSLAAAIIATTAAKLK